MQSCGGIDPDRFCSPGGLDHRCAVHTRPRVSDRERVAARQRYPEHSREKESRDEGDPRYANKIMPQKKRQEQHYDEEERPCGCDAVIFESPEVYACCKSTDRRYEQPFRMP